MPPVRQTYSKGGLFSAKAELHRKKKKIHYIPKLQSSTYWKSKFSNEEIPLTVNSSSDLAAVLLHAALNISVWGLQIRQSTQVWHASVWGLFIFPNAYQGITSSTPRSYLQYFSRSMCLFRDSYESADPVVQKHKEYCLKHL